MKHHVKISVSKEPPKDGIVSVKKASLGKRFIRKFLGKSKKFAIIVPGDSVSDVTTSEVQEEEVSKDAN